MMFVLTRYVLSLCPSIKQCLSTMFMLCWRSVVDVLHLMQLSFSAGDNRFWLLSVTFLWILFVDSYSVHVCACVLMCLCSRECVCACLTFTESICVRLFVSVCSDVKASSPTNHVINPTTVLLGVLVLCTCRDCVKQTTLMIVQH